MIAPASIDWAARHMAAAMSKTWVRRFSAGTVKPLTSPRPRARYRSLMLADARAERLRRLPDDPARGVDDVRVVAEGRGPYGHLDAVGPEKVLVVKHELAVGDVGTLRQRGHQLADRPGRRWVCHHTTPSN